MSSDGIENTLIDHNACNRKFRGKMLESVENFHEKIESLLNLKRDFLVFCQTILRFFLISKCLNIPEVFFENGRKNSLIKMDWIIILPKRVGFQRPNRLGYR